MIIIRTCTAVYTHFVSVYRDKESAIQTRLESITPTPRGTHPDLRRMILVIKLENFLKIVALPDTHPQAGSTGQFSPRRAPGPWTFTRSVDAHPYVPHEHHSHCMIYDVSIRPWQSMLTGAQPYGRVAFPL